LTPVHETVVEAGPERQEAVPSVAKGVQMRQERIRRPVRRRSTARRQDANPRVLPPRHAARPGIDVAAVDRLVQRIDAMLRDQEP
jgi:hypothetical protein